MVEKALITLLTQNEDVEAIIGNRIHAATEPFKWPRPKITYQRKPGTTRIHTNDGPVNLVTCKIQIGCWADTKLVAQTLAQKVRLAIQEYSGTTSGVRVARIFVRDELDAALPLEPGRENSVQGVWLDLECHFFE